ncbi:MAG: NAD-dependent epimerase/dehydratase family protein [Bacilli bacterium]|nr:NAD-dependent epimerase/dehydratase family protein [Bacilli bacterium]
MRVLITGSHGFIGKNLVCRLNEIDDIEIVEFNKEDDFSKIKDELLKLDFIFHLAGVNRPTDVKEFYTGNTSLTEDIINEVESQKLDIPILITSSIQAELDNDYGKSKKEAEEIVSKYGEKHKAYIYRLHNVFGKWCKANYNSVVATFCYNIANGLDITINDKDKTLNLIYIDDVINEFLNVLETGKPSCIKNGICYVSPVYEKNLGYIADKIKEFNVSMKSIIVPETGDDFVKKLFSTYLSYVPLDDMVYIPHMNIDDRGSFTELIRTKYDGQVSVSVSHKDIIRGNHYHHTKMEKFIVVQGMAKITFKHVLTGEEKEYLVDDTEFKIVNIPVGYSHKIQNIGDKEMILLIWCNELFDKEKPDTYYREI